ncbi:unnamed protein product [Dovyalis caffra]|uniref:Uncharacterized protein n=1 Tax=Dovyalis caffra TaxID=77055 RepID=A0AAV1RLX7_9ROSI|nr:unnamed protein product [Dovyalis caffra]
MKLANQFSIEGLLSPSYRLEGCSFYSKIAITSGAPALMLAIDYGNKLTNVIANGPSIIQRLIPHQYLKTIAHDSALTMPTPKELPSEPPK